MKKLIWLLTIGIVVFALYLFNIVSPGAGIVKIFTNTFGSISRQFFPKTVEDVAASLCSYPDDWVETSSRFRLQKTFDGTIYKRQRYTYHQGREMQRQIVDGVTTYFHQDGTFISGCGGIGGGGNGTEFCQSTVKQLQFMDDDLCFE